MVDVERLDRNIDNHKTLITRLQQQLLTARERLDVLKDRKQRAERLSRESKVYVKQRDKLIPAAELLADTICGRDDGDAWNAVYHAEMDRLAFEAGLTPVNMREVLA